ncbi:hypothetical protein FOZ63_009831 [Perkinsus olseni]|uniref:Uncharacterized protein n=1 Tax=Perkinsus olseni TaxID=32597 RepID=A0A7J6N9M0_PEROL|nr:hypothetical protein FOZ63_009831 [Perkinsus olseni]KAF4682649.1 hypothetical protein FOZ60_010279 [Perkinsus olseni]KAF4706391.1 hypothetical protein FOZ62_028922 [Perkinsus olseni]
MGDAPCELLGSTLNISSDHGDCDAVRQDPGSDLSVLRDFFDGGSIAVILNVWEKSAGADINSFEYREKPNGNALLHYSNGPAAGTIKASAGYIKSTFAEIFPIAHIIDELKKRIDGVMNDSQCRELIEFIETRPEVEYENSGRAWLEKFLIEKKDRAIELLEQNGAEISRYEESP